MIDDRNRDLAVVLSYLVGRQLSTVELAQALGVSRSAYYSARDEGRLINADNLLRVAYVFGLNPIDLLIRYRLIDAGAVAEYNHATGSAPDVLTQAPPRRTAKVRRMQPRMDLPPV